MLDELRPPIASIGKFLLTLHPKGLEGAEDRVIRLPFDPSSNMRGTDYVVQFALPNFYFHLTTAYAVLRRNAVPIDKPAFAGQLTTQANIPYIDCSVEPKSSGQDSPPAEAAKRNHNTANVTMPAT